MSDEITDTNHCKISCTDSEKRHPHTLNWRRNTQLYEFRDIRISRHQSPFRNEFWSRFKDLFMTNIIISIRIKTFRTQKIHRTKIIRTTEINETSNIIHSGIITSRTLSTAKTRYSRNAAITHKTTSSTINKATTSWIINSTQFPETIIFIFTSTGAKSLQSSTTPTKKSL